ncbi:G-type lectin S-receptor-like serine/threonine-protein kinase [Dichanthelium oligosanthes]|uniref:non-specific serine/threonine protein kinase n=1 Tax=Dichanthelium oligosanthes TaxID=888268 RepID=A0A1E5VU74_9POAL|nr:G-type lectin S-receptor-like serine/threonine-protein kinase [Dichanthelium oligosanthes]
MLVSGGGDFALGFISPNNSNKSLYLGIWYHNIPERTVKWVANRDNPVTNPSSVKLAITNSPEVVFSDSKGNFVLQLLNGTEVWQSFDHTMLPTMRFVLSYTGQVARRLVAWKGLHDPSTGDFSYSLDPSWQLQDFIWHNTSPYCRTNMFSYMSVGGGIYQSPSLVLYQTRISTEGELDLIYSVSNDSPYTRFSIIGYTGELRFQSWNNNTLSWTVIDEAPSGCDFYASCGPFGYCDFTEAHPTCRNRTFDQCAAECNRNCSCTAHTYADMSDAGTMTDTSRCFIWAGDLVDMRKDTSGENLYLRLADAKSPAGKRHKEAQKRMMLEYLRSTDEAEDNNIEFPFISFEDIVVATDNFSDSNMLGKGGFGKVYKGLLNGTKEVAIKRLSKGSGQGTEEFRNEVVLIAKLQHKNLVKLLGCCIHEDEKLLVYEYLPNKNSAKKPMLQWPTSFKIIQWIARGILYLHQDSRLTIIHRDLKASNILLDKEMSPKISDFGMARILSSDQPQANTNRIVGTYGYMSPEYAMEGAFSVKSDTYSFGVIVSGLKISLPHLIMDFPNLIVYAWNLWKDGKAENLVDSSVKENFPLDEVSRCIHIGLLCVQDSPDYRPLMSAVVSMLESKTTQLPILARPVYFVRRDAEPGRAGNNRALSLNGMSFTGLEGR